MAKSRNRSRDIRKRAAKKRANRERANRMTTTSKVEEPKFKFDNVYCSRCGATFGPGNAGYSHCEDHKGIAQEYED